MWPGYYAWARRFGVSTAATTRDAMACWGRSRRSLRRYRALQARLTRFMIFDGVIQDDATASIGSSSRDRDEREAALRE